MFHTGILHVTDLEKNTWMRDSTGKPASLEDEPVHLPQISYTHKKQLVLLGDLARSSGARDSNRSPNDFPITVWAPTAVLVTEAHVFSYRLKLPGIGTGFQGAGNTQMS